MFASALIAIPALSLPRAPLPAISKELDRAIEDRVHSRVPSTVTAPMIAEARAYSAAIGALLAMRDGDRRQMARWLDVFALLVKFKPKGEEFDREAAARLAIVADLPIWCFVPESIRPASEQFDKWPAGGELRAVLRSFVHPNIGRSVCDLEQRQCACSWIMKREPDVPRRPPTAGEIAHVEAVNAAYQAEARANLAAQSLLARRASPGPR